MRAGDIKIQFTVYFEKEIDKYIDKHLEEILISFMDFIADNEGIYFDRVIINNFIKELHKDAGETSVDNA